MDSDNGMDESPYAASDVVLITFREGLTNFELKVHRVWKISVIKHNILVYVFNHLLQDMLEARDTKKWHH